jgi:HD domain-containing protein
LTRKAVAAVDDALSSTTFERMSAAELDECASDAKTVLRQIGAPERLIRHGELVAEAAEEILAAVTPIVAVDARLVRLGARLHDAGKALHPSELDRPGCAHEEDGEALLLRHAVDPRVARMCRTHARWKTTPDATLEDLLVALADSLWKGRRDGELEGLVIDTVAARAGRGRWDVFTPLDDAFEQVAGLGEERLQRSRA